MRRLLAGRGPVATAPVDLRARVVLGPRSWQMPQMRPADRRIVGRCADARRPPARAFASVVGLGGERPRATRSPRLGGGDLRDVLGDVQLGWWVAAVPDVGWRTSTLSIDATWAEGLGQVITTSVAAIVAHQVPCAKSAAVADAARRPAGRTVARGGRPRIQPSLGRARRSSSRPARTTRRSARAPSSSSSAAALIYCSARCARRAAARAAAARGGVRGDGASHRAVAARARRRRRRRPGAASRSCASTRPSSPTRRRHPLYDCRRWFATRAIASLGPREREPRRSARSGRASGRQRTRPPLALAEELVVCRRCPRSRGARSSARPAGRVAADEEDRCVA